MINIVSIFIEEVIPNHAILHNKVLKSFKAYKRRKAFDLCHKRKSKAKIMK